MSSFNIRGSSNVGTYSFKNCGSADVYESSRSIKVYSGDSVTSFNGLSDSEYARIVEQLKKDAVVLRYK